MKRSFYEEKITALFSTSEFFCFFATLALLIEYKYLRPEGKSARPCEVERSFAGVLVYTPSLHLHGTLQKSISTDIVGDANTPYLMNKTANRENNILKEMHNHSGSILG